MKNEDLAMGYTAKDYSKLIGIEGFKDADEPTPICCAKGMVVMDEFEEGEVKVKENKESAGGL